MSIFKFCPEGWEGEVEVKKLKYVERMQLLIDSGFSISKTGEMEKMDNLLIVAIKNYELCEKTLERIELKHVESGLVAKSLEDLGESSVGMNVINEVAGMIIGGYPLEKSLR